MLIYRAKNKINGKQYIGQTVGSLNKRKKEHVWAAMTKRNNYYFHHAIRKYGSDNFNWTTLYDDVTTIEDLNKLEIFYIKHYNTFENGYNLTKGGSGSVGRIISEETKRKISEAQKGKHHSEESKGKMSEALKGRKLSDEHRKKISKANKGREKTKAERRKLSIAQRGKNNSNYGNFGKDNPNACAVIISNKYFDTRKEAAEFIGVTPSTVGNRIKHKTRWPEYKYV